MKTYITIYLTVSVLLAFAQTPKCEYYNQMYEIEKIENITYSSPKALNSLVTELAMFNIHSSEQNLTEQDLKMDIYKPTNDNSTQRPAIIFAHGGGFLVGNKTNGDMVAMCDSFARKGYVAISIDYRKGMSASIVRFLNQIVGLSISETSSSNAVIRAVQDAQAAIMYLTNNASEYGIDADKIFFVGSSAGAIMGLQNVYMNSESEIPTTIDIDEQEITNYFQNTQAKADALVALWGAVSDINIINNNETTPTLLVHGTDDETVHFESGRPLQNLLGEYPTLQISTPVTYGSKLISEQLSDFDIQHEIYFVKNESHQFYGDINLNMQFTPNSYWPIVYDKIRVFLNNQANNQYSFNYEITESNVSFTSNIENAEIQFWDFGDGNTAIDPNPTHTYSNEGKYSVKLYLEMDNKNYVIINNVQIGNVTSIASAKQKMSEIQYFYDSKSIYIKSSDKSSIYIINNLGQKVFTKFDFAGQTLINTSLFDNGMYHVILENTKETILEKFVVNN